MTQADAKLAVQQLVYTLQGVQQERAPVVVQLGGQPTTLFGVDTADGIDAAEELDVRRPRQRHHARGGRKR